MFYGDEDALRDTINQLYAYIIRGLTPKRKFYTEPLPDGSFRTSLTKRKNYWLYWKKENDKLEATHLKKN